MYRVRQSLISSFIPLTVQSVCQPIDHSLNLSVRHLIIHLVSFSRSSDLLFVPALSLFDQPVHLGWTYYYDEFR